MGEPTKYEIGQVFKRLRAIGPNKVSSNKGCIIINRLLPDQRSNSYTVYTVLQTIVSAGMSANFVAQVSRSICVLCVQIPSFRGGVTPIDSIVTAATALSQQLV